MRLQLEPAAASLQRGAVGNHDASAAALGNFQGDNLFPRYANPVD